MIDTVDSLAAKHYARRRNECISHPRKQPTRASRRETKRSKESRTTWPTVEVTKSTLTKSTHMVGGKRCRLLSTEPLSLVSIIVFEVEVIIIVVVVAVVIGLAK